MDRRGPVKMLNPKELTMVDENVGSVLQSLFTNNARVGKRAIVEYRAATDYLVKRFDAGFKSVGGIAPKARIHGKALRVVGAAGERLTGYCAKACDRISDNAEKIVGRIDDRATGAIDTAAARVSKISNERAARYVAIAGQVSLPPLKLARDVSAWIATRAESRIAPRSVKRSAAKKARRTSKATKKASRGA
jgi:hypothetical protein